MEADKDHIHFLIGYDCTDCVANIVKIVKQKTTYLLWQKYSRYLSKCYWKKKIFWSDGYFACSIGEVSTATIQRYIETQGWERKTALIPPLKSSGFPSPDYFMKWQLVFLKATCNLKQYIWVVGYTRIDV